MIGGNLVGGNLVGGSVAGAGEGCAGHPLDAGHGGVERLEPPLGLPVRIVTHQPQPAAHVLDLV